MPPTARGKEGRLRPAVLHFVVTGRLPPPVGDRDGLVEAFRLKHTHLRRDEYVAQLRALWARHRDEIVDAAGGRGAVARGCAHGPEPSRRGRERHRR